MGAKTRGNYPTGGWCNLASSCALWGSRVCNEECWQKGRYVRKEGKGATQSKRRRGYR